MKIILRLSILLLNNQKWETVLLFQDPSNSYDSCIKTFSGISDIAFPRISLNIKQKDLNNWITKGVPKASKKTKTLRELFGKQDSAE